LENGEGRVAFRANLDAAVTNERFARHEAVLCKRCDVGLAELA
jgi:hypothetical protein